MAITSGLFNSIKGDRKYDAKWFALYFATFIGNGVFPNPSTGLQVVENQNMRTTVKAGQGWINGYFIVNDSDYVLQHDIADGVLKRIDRIVMRLNFSTRAIEVVIKKGAYASSPVVPDLQRDADAYELALADVLINNGATFISQANITDLRLNKSLCGIVHGTVDQVDTTTLFNQYQSWFANMQSTKVSEFDTWMALEQQEFDDWFATIQNILDVNVAGNLLSIITSHMAEDASITKKGHVQLSNKYDGTSQTLAATEKALSDFNAYLKNLGFSESSYAIADINANTLTKTGFYYVNRATGLPPGFTDGYVEVEGIGSGYTAQKFINPFGTKGETYKRLQVGGTWQPWNLILDNTMRNVANGYGGLDSTGKLPSSVLPTKIASIEFLGNGVNNRYIECGFVPSMVISENISTTGKKFLIGTNGATGFNGTTMSADSSKISGTGVTLASGANGPNDNGYNFRLTVLGS